MCKKPLNEYSIADHVTVPGLIEKGMVVVINQQGLWVGVESETFINGHDCHGHGRNGHCLGCPKTHLSSHVFYSVFKPDNID